MGVNKVITIVDYSGSMESRIDEAVKFINGEMGKELRINIASLPEDRVITVITYTVIR